MITVGTSSGTSCYDPTMIAVTMVTVIPTSDDNMVTNAELVSCCQTVFSVLFVVEEKVWNSSQALLVLTLSASMGNINKRNVIFFLFSVVATCCLVV